MMPRNYHDIASRLAPHILHDAREWLCGIFPRQAEYIRSVRASSVLLNLDAQWEYGLHGFIATSILRDKDPFIRPTINLEIAP